MSWKDKISGCFGTGDKKFAVHAVEREHAAELLEAANKANVGLKEYLAEIEVWLNNEQCDSKHIAREMKKVENIGSYLKSD